MGVELLRTGTPNVGAVVVPVKESGLFTASVKGPGSVAAAITVEGSEDAAAWRAILHFELKGELLAHSSFSLGLALPYVRGRLDSIVGEVAVLVLED